MESKDLEKLLSNLSDSQLAAVSGLALKLAEISSEKWTGTITLKCSTVQGGVRDDVEFSRHELIRIKKRKVRSSGI